MIWQSWSDFIAMGGYALYVWGAVLVFFAALALELFSVSQARKSLLRELQLEQLARGGDIGGIRSISNGDTV
ncbi:heme exporter protein CcmD [Undibacterium pigrum]|uniref:Heme exporter protein D n=1 Tax=Undibacterium pigrum TaxID=401470 RepID=A0A318J9T2_9BURK|nr:heme exporter protein CcmD [Undibacterium pigrum]PXX44069.1 heme exporter protein D [Undibacterium pigrum]